MPMEHQTEGKQRQRASVPAFGGWEGGAPPDYSLDFSKIRAARIQRRKALSWSSFVGNAAAVEATGGVAKEKQPWPSAAGGGGDGDRERRRHRRRHSDAIDDRQPIRPGRAAPKGKSNFTGYFFGCMGRW